MPLKRFQQSEKKPLSGVKHVIAIAAGKGGVGKSSVTVNLGLALKQAGYAVGIMDTDIYGPSIRKMLPEDRLPAQKGQTIIPAMSQGIQVISMAYFRSRQEATAVRAPIANGVVTQFIKNVEWGNLDYLLIDFPPGTGDIQLTLSQQANLSGALMVTTPQEVSVMDVTKAMHLFDQVKVPIIGIIENMSYYVYEKTKETLYLFGKGGGERLARERGVPYLGGIPIDPALCKCGDLGVSLFSRDSSCQAANAFIKLAESVVAHTSMIKENHANRLESFELAWKEMSE